MAVRVGEILKHIGKGRVLDRSDPEGTREQPREFERIRWILLPNNLLPRRKDYQFDSSNISRDLIAGVTIAIELLLSARVADGMVHTSAENRYHPNRELFGQGIATAVSSVFGGLPATGAIARASVNVRAGAKSRLAAVIHAATLLFAALIAAPWVSQIPAAAIAGVLIGTSYRILNPRSLMESLRTTKREAIVLLVTAVATLSIDLIWGIAIGIALYAFLHRKRSN